MSCGEWLETHPDASNALQRQIRILDESKVVARCRSRSPRDRRWFGRPDSRGATPPSGAIRADPRCRPADPPIPSRVFLPSGRSRVPPVVDVGGRSDERGPPFTIEPSAIRPFWKSLLSSPHSSPWPADDFFSCRAVEVDGPSAAEHGGHRGPSIAAVRRRCTFVVPAIEDSCLR